MIMNFEGFEKTKQFLSKNSFSNMSENEKTNTKECIYVVFVCAPFPSTICELSLFPRTMHGGSIQYFVYFCMCLLLLLHDASIGSLKRMWETLGKDSKRYAIMIFWEVFSWNVRANIFWEDIFQAHISQTYCKAFFRHNPYLTYFPKVAHQKFCPTEILPQRNMIFNSSETVSLKTLYISEKLW